MNDAFTLLEEKVEKAAATLKRLAEENATLRSNAALLEGRLKEAQKAADAHEKRKTGSADEVKRLESLQKEVRRLEGELADLRGERLDVRDRVARLVTLLGELEA